MILSSDELEIIAYLKSWQGKSIAMLEICRCAGSRKKFKENPHWAKCMMTRLVETKLIAVNERGHYRFPIELQADLPTIPHHPLAKEPRLVGDDYFPVVDEPVVVGEDYFPSSEEPDPEAETKWWLSPQILPDLKRAEEEKQEKI